MKKAYELLHRHVVEIADDEEVCDTKLLGLFSTEEKCQEAIKHYTTQPGFEAYPDCFEINVIEADVDEYNDEVGEFSETVYLLSHEWYDGEYDYITYIGYYSTREKAEKVLALFENNERFIEHQDGFDISVYNFDEMMWEEGFCCEDDEWKGAFSPENYWKTILMKYPDFAVDEMKKHNISILPTDAKLIEFSYDDKCFGNMVVKIKQNGKLYAFTTDRGEIYHNNKMLFGNSYHNTGEADTFTKLIEGIRVELK